MTKQELLRALEPFDDETQVCVSIQTGNGPFELATVALDYAPMRGDYPAYVVLRTYVNAHIQS